MRLKNTSAPSKINLSLRDVYETFTRHSRDLYETFMRPCAGVESYLLPIWPVPNPILPVTAP